MFISEQNGADDLQCLIFGALWVQVAAQRYAACDFKGVELHKWVGRFLVRRFLVRRFLVRRFLVGRFLVRRFLVGRFLVGRFLVSIFFNQ